MKDLIKIIIGFIAVLSILLLAACSTSGQPPTPQPNDEEEIVEVDTFTFPVSATLRITPYFGDSLGWKSQDYYYETIQFPDINGDGKDDVCGRTSGGVFCYVNSQGQFQPFHIIFSNFSNSNNWHTDPAYWKTIQFPDINGDGKDDVCGRGIDGIICGISHGNRFGPPKFWNSSFSDQGLWKSHPAYWSTIQFPDVNGDGKDDVCGRGIDGIWCATSNGNDAFISTKLWSKSFRDAHGWKNHDYYYATIQFGDLDADGKDDICGRGAAGIWCGLSSGSDFTNISLWTTQYSNAAHWHTSPAYWSTIQLADINRDGRADVCGRGFSGIYCGLSTTARFVYTSTLHAPNFSDSNGWKEEPYYATLRFVDVDGDNRADVCGRGYEGIYCAHSTSSAGIPRFGTVYHRVNNFRDRDGWKSSPAYWKTVQPANIDSSSGFEWCGRGVKGIYCSLD